MIKPYPIAVEVHNDQPLSDECLRALANVLFGMLDAEAAAQPESEAA